MRWAPLSTFASFANRNYLLLWLGMICLMVAHTIALLYALSYMMSHLFERLLLFSIVNAITILLLSLWGGAIADRLNRKKIIQWGQGLSAAIALVVAVLIETGLAHWTHLFAAWILQVGLWSFMMPALRAIIPEIVGEKNLTNGLALVLAGMSAVTLVAGNAEGVLYVVIGPYVVIETYFLVAALGLLAMASTSMVRYEGSSTVRAKVPTMGSDTKPEAGPRRSVVAEIGQGLSYIWSKGEVRLLLLVGFLFIFFSAPLESLLPALIAKVYRLDSEAVGLLARTSEVGALVGTVMVAGLRENRRGKLFVGAGALTGAAMVAIGLFPIYGLAIGAMVAAGLGTAGVWSLNQILILGQVENRYRGRVMSIFMMNSGLVLFAVLQAGTIADFVGPRPLLMGLGALIVWFSAFVPIRVRALR